MTPLVGLTDDVTDIPRSIFLQLGQHDGLKRQGCNAEEEIPDAIACQGKDEISDKGQETTGAKSKEG